jgi:hypothetical protein
LEATAMTAVKRIPWASPGSGQVFGISDIDRDLGSGIDRLGGDAKHFTFRGHFRLDVRRDATSR